MYKIYFKQAIQMLKQNRFISTITIIGTAVAIMMVMVIIVTDAINNISVIPEINRHKTMYIKAESQKSKTEDMLHSGPVSYENYKEYISKLKTPELISFTSGGSIKNRIVNAESSRARFTPPLMQVDANYWKIMSFSFLEGKPFNQEEVASGIKYAVISETMAEKLFGKEKALGKTIEIDFHPYKITGIVRDVSGIFKYSSADIWIPYTSVSGFEKGGGTILILAKDKSDLQTIYEEVKDCERKFNAIDSKWNLTFNGPYDHRSQLLLVWSNIPPDIAGSQRKMVFILAVLLIIPAVNLSSFSMSRIKRRTEEIGIRKAFGAKRYIILIQVLYENFITSLIGGVIGLLLSYIAVIQLKEWLLDVSSDTVIPIQTLISLPVFIGVFAVCLLLNLISAGIPAYKASRISIVDSLNQNNI